LLPPEQQPRREAYDAVTCFAVVLIVAARSCITGHRTGTVTAMQHSHGCDAMSALVAAVHCIFDLVQLLLMPACSLCAP
jgi:hypothetical protein